MVALVRTRRSSAVLAAQLGVRASEAALRAERWRRPLEDAGTDCIRGLRRVARAAPPDRVLVGEVKAQLAAYTLESTRIVGLALRREGAWSEEALDGLLGVEGDTPLVGGNLRESLNLLEARQSQTSRFLSIIQSSDYEARMLRWSKKLTDADPVAQIIASGIARGANLDTIARRVLPYVQGYANSAMRIVRTETARVHNQLAEQKFKLYADDIAGYQILSQLDSRVRPEHAVRHGRIFPVGKARPSLPDAPNCRCYYAPIFKPDAKGFKKSRTFSTQTYDDWFSVQTDQTKIQIVGKQRWDLVRSKGFRKPKWQDFSNLRTGKLLSPETIKRFSPKRIRTRRKLS